MWPPVEPMGVWIEPEPCVCVPPPDAVAWLVTVPERFDEIATVSVTVGKLVPAATVFGFVQDTLPTSHVHPFPDMLLAVRPVGRLSASVTSPLLDPVPLLLRVIEYCPVPPGAKAPSVVMPIVHAAP